MPTTEWRQDLCQDSPHLPPKGGGAYSGEKWTLNLREGGGVSFGEKVDLCTYGAFGPPRPPPPPATGMCYLGPYDKASVMILSCTFNV